MEQLENLSYEQYRLIAKDGDVVFFHGTDKFFSRLIMFATGSVHSHVAFAFWATIGNKPRLLLVEAHGNTRRRIISASYYKARKISVRRCPVEWSSIADTALAKIGEISYSYLDAACVGVREFVWNNFNIRLPNVKNKGEICSEFVARTLDIQPVEISPGTLYEKLKVLFPSK